MSVSLINHRRYGWIGSREEFACQYLQRQCQLLELKIVGIGIGFLQKNQGTIQIILNDIRFMDYFVVFINSRIISYDYFFGISMELVYVNGNFSLFTC